ncbi:hypothetical protein GKQ23_10990 [Erwinia sp. E602]|uniref:hypothetical protein n=1 Tax=Erwinia sp. E602 TaxID=2675378 RepID=UPI001BA7E0AE|nr:hypothetical protein [Erwinia sp. E602]QUG75481.1 hypothetical protein GKQ23_10990 [Erwinia sp. E602]
MGEKKASTPADFLVILTVRTYHVLCKAKELCASSVSMPLMMFSLDPTLLALAGFAAYKLISNHYKSKKAERLDNKEIYMNENNSNSLSNFTVTTSYNAMCGVLGNVIYEVVHNAPALKI